MRGKAGDLQRLFHIAKWCRKLGVVQAKVQTYEHFIAKEIREELFEETGIIDKD